MLTDVESFIRGSVFLDLRFASYLRFTAVCFARRICFLYSLVVIQGHFNRHFAFVVNKSLFKHHPLSLSFFNAFDEGNCKVKSARRTVTNDNKKKTKYVSKGNPIAPWLTSVLTLLSDHE